MLVYSLFAAILEARRRLGTKAKIFLVSSPIIYGANAIYGRLSIQVPTLTRFAMKHQYSGHVGRDKWDPMHAIARTDCAVWVGDLRSVP